MVIDCGDGLFLKSNSCCFYLAKEEKKKDGTMGETAFAYYSDFHQAIEGLARHKLLKSRARSFDGLKKDMDAILQEVEKIRLFFNDTMVKGEATRAA